MYISFNNVLLNSPEILASAQLQHHRSKSQVVQSEAPRFYLVEEGEGERRERERERQRETIVARSIESLHHFPSLHFVVVPFFSSLSLSLSLLPSP